MKRIYSCPALLCFSLSSMMWSQTPATHQIVKFDVPGAGHGFNQGTLGSGIADDGTIMGFYYDSNSVQHGFLRSPAGEFATFDPPGSTGTRPRGMNSAHTVVGEYYDSAGVLHGFVRYPNGNIRTFNAPHAGKGINQGTSLGSITTSLDIAGYYLDSNTAYHGFLILPGPKFIEFDAPGAGRGSYQGTTPASTDGLTEDGTVVGSYTDSAASHGFIRAPDGTFTEFDPTGSIGTYVSGTNSQGTVTGLYVAFGPSFGFRRTSDGEVTTFGDWNSFSVGTINDTGSVTGWFYDSQLKAHAYVSAPDGAITDFSAPGSGTGSSHGTYAFANNAAGGVTGCYNDSDGVYHGFVLQ